MKIYGYRKYRQGVHGYKWGHRFLTKANLGRYYNAPTIQQSKSEMTYSDIIEYPKSLYFVNNNIPLKGMYCKTIDPFLTKKLI